MLVCFLAQKKGGKTCGPGGQGGWANYFARWNKMPVQSNLRKEGLIWACGLKVLSVTKTGMDTEAWGGWSKTRSENRKLTGSGAALPNLEALLHQTHFPQ